MTDYLPSSSSTTFLQSPGKDGFYEPRQNESVALAWILASLQKYWYVSLLVSTVMMAGIVYKTQKEPRIYMSGVQIVIDLNSKSSLADKLATSTGGLPEDRTATIETITQTLKSKTIIQQAIDNIPDRELRPPIDTALRGLKIQPGKNSNVLSITYIDTVPRRTVATLNALSKAYIDYSITTKKASTDKSITFVEAQLPESRKRLEVAAQEVEQFRQKYRFFDPETSTKALIDYRQSIITKLNEARVQYDQTQNQYEELKQQLIAVGLKSDNILSATMLTQDTVYQDLFKKLNDLELIYSQERLRFSDSNPLVIAAKGKRDQMFSLLKNRAQQVLKRDVQEADLTNGGIANFSNNLAQNLANKQVEIVTSLASQKAQYQSSYKVYQQIEAQLAQLPNLQKQYTELQRQYNIHSQELTAFLQKLQELKIADAEQVVPWKLLDPPELPQNPISPDVPRQIGLGTLGSLLVGVLAAMGLKKLDNRIDNPETVKSMSGMPILSLIPTVDSFEQGSMGRGNFLQIAKIVKNQNHESQDHSYWNFIEAIRILALSIRLTTDREDRQTGKVIAMTSALPKEGKSTLTFHTSIALAELGYRVLLVDVDLHKSSISRLCRSSALFESTNLDSDAGLCDALLKDDKWEDLIKTSLQLKLDVLFAGEQSVNSITLLNSPRFTRLIEEWRDEYDYVIFDTPPIVGLSDTRLIGSLVDGLVYVVSLHNARRRSIDLAVDVISSLQTPVLGLAINRVENHYSGYNKYYNYYQKSDSLTETVINSKLIDTQR